MNWPLAAAGMIALVGSLIHGIIGDRLVRRIDADRLGRKAKFLIRVTWHLTTIAFVVLGGVLIFVGVEPQSVATTGVAYTAGAVLSSWSAFVLIASFVRAGVRGLVSHPAPIMLLITAVLIWRGTTWL